MSLVSVKVADENYTIHLPFGSVDLHCLMPNSEVLISCHKTGRDDSVIAFCFLFCGISFQPLKKDNALFEEWNRILNLRCVQSSELLHWMFSFFNSSCRNSVVAEQNKMKTWIQKPFSQLSSYSKVEIHPSLHSGT